MTTIAEFIKNDPTRDYFQCRVGADVVASDLLEFGPDGTVYPVGCTTNADITDLTYGTAQTSEATGRIVAQTQVVGVSGSLAHLRQAVVTGDGGEIFILTPQPNTYDMRLTKYLSDGTLGGYADIGATTDVLCTFKLLKLSNGNLACIAKPDNSTLRFAVVSQNLATVKPHTISGEAGYGSCYDAVALSGGGFAVVYQSQDTYTLSRLVTYDNAGTIVTAPVTIRTTSGTPGIMYHRVVQLSNGNLAIGIASNFGDPGYGLYHGVVDASGAIVSAFASVHATAATASIDMAVLSGYYCICGVNGTDSDLYASVFSNAGALQGTGFNSSTVCDTATTTSNQIKLFGDGTNFWMIWKDSQNSKTRLTKIPVTGTGYLTTDITPATTNYSHPIDAFYANGFIVGISMPPSGDFAPQVFVCSPVTGQLYGPAFTVGAAPGTTSGVYPTIVDGGDFSFIAVYDYASTASVNFCTGKYATTAVIGVAAESKTAGNLVKVSGLAGTYVINQIKGRNRSFDHSSSMIAGNKGTMMPNSVVLRGL